MTSRHNIIAAIAIGVALSLGTGIASASAVTGVPTPPHHHLPIHLHAPIKPIPPIKVGAKKSPRLAYAGDSTTAQPDSWMHVIKGVKPVPGFAHSGYTSTQVLANIKATRAEVLIIKVGINDFRYGTSLSTIRHNVRQIALKAGVRRVLISAICPNDNADYGVKHYNRKSLNEQLNASLKAEAARYGYSFIDPDAGYRGKHGGYKASAYTRDGTHPSTKLYKIEAQRIAAKVKAMVG